MTITSKIYRPLVTGCLLSCILPGMAQASGFALIENSASGQGNAYAGGSAHTTDASTIYFNPAGMMRLEGDQISIAGHFISPKSSFTNNGSALFGGADINHADSSALNNQGIDGGKNALVPNIYWIKTIDEQMKFGLGVQTSFGLATKYDDKWVGRYHAVETDLKTINFNPSLAYRVNDRLSIGGGIDIIVGDIIFSNAVETAAICDNNPNLPANCGTAQNPDAFAELTGDNNSDPGYGFNFGLQYLVTEQTVLGLSYRSEIDLDFKGKADFTFPTAIPTAVVSGITSTGSFKDTTINSSVTLPASLSLSVAHKVNKVTYLADITWTGWSSFDKLVIDYATSQPDTLTTENWDDTMRYSVGMDYQYTNKMILRTGLAYDETPIPDATHRTARIPTNDRTWLSFGLNYTLDEQSSIDVAYSHLFIDDSEINNTLEATGTGAVLNSTLTGNYEASVDILSVQWNRTF